MHVWELHLSYIKSSVKISLHSKVKILENLDRGVDLTNKKSQIKIFFLKISDPINMTEFWLEHDQKFFTTTSVNVRTWPKNLHQQTLTIEHDRKIH